MGISVFPAPSSSVSTGFQTFKTSSTWTAPAGVTSVNCFVVGAGGGGGGSANATTNSNYNFAAGGGAGGQVIQSSTTVVPGTTYTVTVGAGGTGAVMDSASTSNSVASQSGGYSSFALNYSLANAITNGSGEANATGWLLGRANGYSISSPPSWTSGYNNTVPSEGNVSNQATSNAGSGSTITGTTGTTKCYLINQLYPSGVSTDYGDQATWVPVTGSTQYTFSGYFNSGPSNSSVNVGIYVNWYTTVNGSNISATGSGSTNIGNSWNRITLTATAPSNATYALVRYQAYSPQQYGGGAYFGAAQVETGSSATSYKSVNTAGLSLVPGLGIITINNGVIAIGGGGGQSGHTGQFIAGNGFGGGAATSNGGSLVIGGNGAGAGTPPGQPTIVGSNATMPYIASIYNYNSAGGGYSRGGIGYRLDGSAGYLLQGPGTSGVNGFGAGGLGATYNQSLPGVAGFGAGTGSTGSAVGNNALVNTGAGGGGAMCSPGASVTGYNGGNGGSGIVMISW